MGLVEFTLQLRWTCFLIATLLASKASFEPSHHLSLLLPTPGYIHTQRQSASMNIHSSSMRFIRFVILNEKKEASEGSSAGSEISQVGRFLYYAGVSWLYLHLQSRHWTRNGSSVRVLYTHGAFFWQLALCELDGEERRAMCYVRVYAQLGHIKRAMRPCTVQRQPTLA